jgi:GMP synthase (glutamine-hydrolysing)
VLIVGRLDHDRATALINTLTGVNRVIASLQTAAPVPEMRVRPCSLTPERIARVRRADAIVRRLSRADGFDRRVWQFPVVLIPLGIAERPDSIVLRPVESVDGMTARAAPIEPTLLEALRGELMRLDGVAGVFLDLTHKPPATIEWE